MIKLKAGFGFLENFRDFIHTFSDVFVHYIRE